MTRMMVRLHVSIFIIFLMVCQSHGKTETTVAQLNISGQIACVLFDDITIARLNTDWKEGKALTMVLALHTNGCQKHPNSTFGGHLVVQRPGACYLQQQMKATMQSGASGLLIVTSKFPRPAPTRLAIRPIGNKSIPVGVMSAHLLAKMLNDSGYAGSRNPIPILIRPVRFERGLLSLLVFPIMATLCLICGAWLSIYGLSDLQSCATIGAPQSQPQANQNNANVLTVTAVVSVVILLIIAVSMLLLLYFFYDVMVWFVIVVILYVFAVAWKSVLMEIILRLPVLKDLNAIIPIRTPWKVNIFGPEIDLRGVAIFPFCAIPSIMWFVYRKTPHAVWIIQNLCGMVAIIHVLKSVRFRNLKIIAIMVSLFFVYDIFMVYITPLFMKSTPEPALYNLTTPQMPVQSKNLSRTKRSAPSVMEAVATGQAGKSGEKIPLAFILPSWDLAGNEVLSPCSLRSFSILGFGDILIPGFLVAFSYFCDVVLESSACGFRLCRYVYFAISLVGYNVGLGLVYILLIVMKSGQPALITLIPCTLLPLMGISLARGHFTFLWNGHLPNTNTSANDDFKDGEQDNEFETREDTAMQPNGLQN